MKLLPCLCFLSYCRGRKVSLRNIRLIEVPDPSRADLSIPEILHSQVLLGSI